MKKVVLILLTAITVISCGDDDRVNQPDILGTYKLVHFETSNAVDLNNDGISTTDLISESGCYNNSSLTLQSGNNAILRMQSIDVEYISTDDAGENYDALVECLDAEEEAATYTFANGIINLAVGDLNIEFSRSGNRIFCSQTGDDEFGVVYLIYERQ